MPGTIEELKNSYLSDKNPNKRTNYDEQKRFQSGFLRCIHIEGCSTGMEQIFCMNKYRVIKWKLLKYQHNRIQARTLTKALTVKYYYEWMIWNGNNEIKIFCYSNDDVALKSESLIRSISVIRSLRDMQTVSLRIVNIVTGETLAQHRQV